MRKTPLLSFFVTGALIVSASTLSAQSSDSSKAPVSRTTTGNAGTRTVSKQGNGQGGVTATGGATGNNGNSSSFERTTTPANGSGTATSSGTRTTMTGRSAGYDASATRSDTGVTVKSTATGPRGRVANTEGMVQRTDTGVTRTTATTNANGKTIRSATANTAAAEGAVTRTKVVRTPTGGARTRTMRATRP
jgi:hypothetical protein